MPDLQLPKPARLGGPGLYSLPKAVTCRLLVFVGSQLPVRIHVALEDETELYLPMTEDSLTQLYSSLKEHFGK